MKTIKSSNSETRRTGSCALNGVEKPHTDLPGGCPDPEKRTFKGPSGLKPIKFIIGGVIFLALSIGVFQYQFNQHHEDYFLYLRNRLEWGYLLLMFLVIPLESVIGGLRIWMVCRVLQPGITYWMCLKAELVNIGSAMLTPSQSGGGVGQIYILCRGGATVGSSTTISFISFAGTMIVLLGIGLYSIFFSDVGNMKLIFEGAVLTFIIIILCMLLIASFPSIFIKLILNVSRLFGDLKIGFNLIRNRHSSDIKDKKEISARTDIFERLVQLINKYHESLRLYLKAGKTNFIWVLILSFLLFFSRSLVAFLCIRFLGLNDPSFSQIIGTQLILLFVIYFAPTPGGAGLSEYLSLSVMSGIIPLGIAPYYNLLWRTTTLYMPAVAGLICLSHAVIVEARGYISGIVIGHSKVTDSSSGLWN